MRGVTNAAPASGLKVIAEGSGSTRSSAQVDLPSPAKLAVVMTSMSGGGATSGSLVIPGVTVTASVRETVVVTVINNSMYTLEVSYCRRLAVVPNISLPAHTTKTYDVLTQSLFVVKPGVESRNIQVESSQQYSAFLSYDNVFGALVYNTAFTLTVTHN